jgi:hypothetical protein
MKGLVRDELGTPKVVDHATFQGCEQDGRLRLRPRGAFHLRSSAACMRR